LAKGVIRVERAWDPKAALIIEPKSRAGRRSVPIAGVLRDHLLTWKIRSGCGEGLVFGRDGKTPFHHGALWDRATTAWAAANEKEIEKAKEEERKPTLLAPFSMHEARHTFASLMIAAGVNAKALSTYMGHASVTTTYDRYGHLMPGNEEEAAALLDAYLARADTRARLAQVEA
jgi:integrase